MSLHSFSAVALMTINALTALAGALHLLPRLGSIGRRISDAACRAPLLDWIIAYFTVAPLVVGPILAGWRGFGGAVVGQLATLLLWTFAHELAHPQVRRGPRIVKAINRKVGAVRNITAVFVTAAVTPLFCLVRLAEILVYPPLNWLVHLPAYNHADWVNVSRHKFSGLIGHDRIWCLYCDWMTGVWSLGSEMLRNVESFWCPIRFASNAKCENCRVDFPDLENGWVSAHGDIAEVAQTIDAMYSERPGPRAWFGHPVRLTVNGKEPTRQELAEITA